MTAPDSTSSPKQQQPASEDTGACSGGVSAAARWQGAGRAVCNAVRLSQRLTTLRDQLGDSAFVEWQQLDTLKHLGQGSFAEVSACRFRPSKDDPWQLAVPRVVARKQIRTELLGDPAEVAAFVDEVKLLRKLKHKTAREAEFFFKCYRKRYIVEFYGAGWSKETEEQESQGREAPSEQQLFYLQEYMEGASLQQAVLKAMTSQGKQYSDKDALRWALQIALALEYLHTLNPKVVHRDLKAENILLTSPKLSEADAKLADFGLARRLQKASMEAKSKSLRLERLTSTKPDELDEMTRSRSQQLERTLSSWMSKRILPVEREAYEAVEMTGATGSLGSMAPEVLMGKPYNERADVFSMGVILYNIFYRNLPHVHILLNGTYEDLELYAYNVAQGFRPPLGSQVAPGVRSLIERCWKGLPELRPSMSEVVRDLQALQQQAATPGDVAKHPSGGGCCTIM